MPPAKPWERAAPTARPWEATVPPPTDTTGSVGSAVGAQPPPSLPSAGAVGLPRKPWESGGAPSSSWARTSTSTASSSLMGTTPVTPSSSAIVPNASPSFGGSAMRPPLDSFRGAFGFSSGSFGGPYGGMGMGSMGYSGGFGAPYGNMGMGLGYGSSFGYGGQPFTGQGQHQPFGQFYRTIEENIYAFNGFFSSLLMLIGRTTWMYNEGITVIQMVGAFCRTLAFVQLLGAPVRWIYRVLLRIPLFRWIFRLFGFGTSETFEKVFEGEFR